MMSSASVSSPPSDSTPARAAISDAELGGTAFMDRTWTLPENDWTITKLVVLSYNPDLEHQAIAYFPKPFGVDGQTGKSMNSEDLSQ
ncbi:exported hypothetical protein [Mesorhizobium sp. SOD10]|nr:exported hypothetical protein [Mesorhizobium sp. SOD10]